MLSNEKKVKTAWAALEASDQQPLTYLWRLQAIDYLLSMIDSEQEIDTGQLAVIHDMMHEFHQKLGSGLSELENVRVAA